VIHKSAPAPRSAAAIAQALEADIRAGRYESNSLLPAVREHAASLKVSSATVAAAYRLLQVRGLVIGDRRRGTRVRRPAHAERPAVREHRGSAEGLVDLASGNPDPQLLPPLLAALTTLGEEPTAYGERSDHGGLVTFARSEMAADGLRADDVMVTNGGLDAIERVLREYLYPGSRVAIEDPCHPAVQDLLFASGYSAEPFAVDAEGPEPASLANALVRKPAAVIITPRAQNPTGAAITSGRAAELRSVLKREREVLLIENDPFGPISGVGPVTLTAERKHWAVVRSTSKFLGPDLRVAILAGDATTLARVRGRQAAGVRWVSHLLQQLTLALWSDPGSGRLLARAAALYAHRRTALLRALAAHDVKVSTASGFNVWIPVRHESVVIQRLAEAGWTIAPGERFRLKSGPGIRITTSALEPDASLRLAGDLASALRWSPPAPG
jgi:DNA-binding transcriptional MocR family regulator